MTPDERQAICRISWWCETGSLAAALFTGVGVSLILGHYITALWATVAALWVIVARMQRRRADRLADSL